MQSSTRTAHASASFTCPLPSPAASSPLGCCVFVLCRTRRPLANVSGLLYSSAWLRHSGTTCRRCAAEAAAPAHHAYTRRAGATRRAPGARRRQHRVARGRPLPGDLQPRRRGCGVAPPPPLSARQGTACCPRRTAPRRARAAGASARAPVRVCASARHTDSFRKLLCRWQRGPAHVAHVQPARWACQGEPAG